MPKPKSQKPTTSKSPDWSYWGNLATVNLREALQLSLGLDPHSHVPASEPDMSLRELYWNRLLIAKNQAPGADWVVGKVVREDGDINPEFTEVYLKKFADWMINETTLSPFPDEFRNLVTTPKKASQTETVDQTLEPTQPRYLLVNGDRESAFYFARQPLSVLEDLLRHHGGKFERAAEALKIKRQHLSRVINNLRAGRKPWSDK